MCLWSLRRERFVSSDMSQATTGLFSYLDDCLCGTRKVQPCLSDQISGYPSQRNFSRSGAMRVRTVKLMDEVFEANRSLYHRGIPGFFWRANGVGSSPFF